MTALTRGADRYFQTSRPPGRREAAYAPGAAENSELGRSLLLLRTTGIHISLFRFSFLDHDFADGYCLLAWAFWREGILGRLPDGSIALMLVNPGPDDRLTENRVVEELAAACRRAGMQGTIEMTASHRSASDIADFDDLVLHLMLPLPQRITVEEDWVA